MTAVAKGWSRRLPPLQIEIDCRGTRHRIRWVRGSVVSLDHDLVGEQVIAALGGAALPCLEIVRLLTRVAEAPQILLKWNEALVTGDAPTMMRSRRMAKTLFSALSKASPAFASLLSREAVLVDVPIEVLDRIALARVVRLGRRAAEDEMEQLDLELAVSVRAKPALEACMRTWTRRPPDGLPHVECRLGDPDQPPAIARDGGGACELRLSPRWLPEVWAPGLALVDGCFVLGVDRARGAAAAVQVVRWERRRGGEEAPVVFAARVRRSRNGWRLDWT